MAKFTNDGAFDAALNYIETNAERLVALASYTLGDSYATVTGGSNILASVAIDGGDFTGPADGTSGRKLTVGAQAAVTIIASGTATHVAILKDSATAAVLHVREVEPDLALVDNDANTVSFPEFVIQFNDAT